MSKKTIRLSEKDFQKKLNEAVLKTVRNILKEGFDDSEMAEKWIEAERQLGSENMLQEVYNYFNSNQLMNFLQQIDYDYDLCLFNPAFNYDEDDDDENDSLYEEIDNSQRPIYQTTDKSNNVINVYQISDDSWKVICNGKQYSLPDEMTARRYADQLAAK